MKNGDITKMHSYKKGQITIVENKKLDDKIQKVKFKRFDKISSLNILLNDEKVNFITHLIKDDQSFFLKLTNYLIPVIFLLGFIFLLQRTSNNIFIGPNQLMNIRKSQAKIKKSAQTGVFFDMVAGIDEAKEELQEIVTFLKTPKRFIEVGAVIPKGVLLVGPPGTGKTLLAKAVAGEAGVPFISISGSEFIEMFVGVGASRVRDLFKTAKKNAPCLLFIDEIDAIGRQRGTGIGGNNDEREQALNQLLTEMDGFRNNTGIIVIGATNRVDFLDVALLRPGRFNRQITIYLPDVKGRKEILKIHARNKKFATNVSIEAIAQRTPGFSGADLANLLNEAAIGSARQNNETISIININLAFDRIIAGLEGQNLKDAKNKRLIAYHEGGHAIVGTLLPYHNKVEKVTIIPRGQAQGLTWFIPNENQKFISQGELTAHIIGLLGGRAAEEIVFGEKEVTTGAMNDFQRATQIARQMVTEFGMSKLGPIFIKFDNNDTFFLGREIELRSEESQKMLNLIDDEVNSIIKYCYNQARKIILNNRIVLDNLVEYLINNETINMDELENNIKAYSLIPK
ncbi:MAG: ATP-dependent zinc metalloprotease FtsH [Alphaproteobacteria bacterium]|nr:ATP-dependent zinc metalloprotease FtsH [Alphaproteobacteria bacterium]